jgi:hypothetical protein
MSANLSEMIRQKERELHEIHEMRCSTLESSLVEKEASLKEASDRFTQLRDDFEYNLSLLETRDKEVGRLDSLLQQAAVEKDKKEMENKALLQRLDRYLEQEKHNKVRESETTATSKVVLQEMYQEIESVRWAMTEELKARQKEILGLKADLRRLQTSREQALQSQRHDLSSTFENMLTQREAAFKEREKSLTDHLALLEGKLEETRLEALRVKTDASSGVRRIEQLGEELLQKDEQKRQLSWQLEDVRGAKATDAEAHRRREGDLERELDSLRDTLVSREKKERDSGLELSSLRNELRQEGERRQAAEAAARDAARALSEERANALRLLTENADREEQLLGRMKTMQQLGEAQAAALGTAQTAAEEGETKAAQLEQTRAALKEATQDLTQMLKETADMDAEAKRLRGALDESHDEVGQLRVELERVREEEREAADRESRMQLEAEGREAELDALRVRLTLHQNVVRLTGVGGGHGGVAPGSEPRGDLARSMDTAASPLFSEDMGPASLPTSPQHMMSPSKADAAARMFHGNHLAPEGGEDQEADDGDGDGKPSSLDALNLDLTASDGAQSAFPVLAANVAANTETTAALSRENDWLKTVVRDMRSEMEVLQQRLSASPVRVAADADAAGARADDGRGGLLETRLQQATAEIVRLRDERRKLMNLGNEMRAALNRQKREILTLQHADTTPVGPGMGMGMSMGMHGTGAGGQAPAFYVPASLQAHMPPPPPQQQQQQQQDQQDHQDQDHQIQQDQQEREREQEGDVAPNGVTFEVVGTGVGLGGGPATSSRGAARARTGRVSGASLKAANGAVRSDEGTRAAASKRVMNYAQARAAEERERRVFDDAEAAKTLPF